MKVTCISNDGSKLPQNRWRKNAHHHTDSYQYVQVGQSYTVYGVLVFADTVEYLLVPKANTPRWVSGALFKVVDQSLPPGMGIVMTRTDPSFTEVYDYFDGTIVLGYDLLVRSMEHFTDIMELDAAAIDAMEPNIREIDAYYSAGQGWV